MATAPSPCSVGEQTLDRRRRGGRGPARRCGTTWARRSPSASAPRTSAKRSQAPDCAGRSAPPVQGAPHRGTRLGDRRALRRRRRQGADRRTSTSTSESDERRGRPRAGRTNFVASFSPAAGSAAATRRGRRRHQPAPLLRPLAAGSASELEVPAHHPPRPPDLRRPPVGGPARSLGVGRGWSRPVRGISRHVVRFVAYGDGMYALKEDQAARAPTASTGCCATRRAVRLPVVEAVGVASGRSGRRRRAARRRAHHPPPRRSRCPTGRCSLRRPCSSCGVRCSTPWPSCWSELHLAGFFWGDCSLSNTLFRRDAGALRGVARRRRDGRAAAGRCPTASAPTTSRSPR